MTRPVQPFPTDRVVAYRAAGHWRGDTFPALLRRLVAEHANRTAVVDGERRLTYADLATRAQVTAAGLLALGLRPGDRVLVQMPNRVETLLVVWALFAAGLLPVYALPAHRRTEVAHFLDKSGARAYIVPDRADGFDHVALAKTLKDEIATLDHVIVAGGAQGFVALEDLRGDPAILPDDPDPQSVAFLQISGGSTGLSKLIPRTHDDYIYTLRESARICGLTPDSRYLAALPVSHNFTMSSPGWLGAMYAGATVVLAPRPAPDVCFRLIAAEGVTIAALVPPLAMLWIEAARLMKPDLSTLEVLQVGGAKFPPEAAKRVRPALGCQLQQVFGMAEGLVNYTRLDDPDDIVTGTQGRPISPDDEVLITDDAGNPVPDGTPGHLLTRGPYTINAYHNDDGANARSFTADGFYRTGDIVVRGAGGYLTVQGRATDHINRAGEKISAEEIEDHLLAHPQVFDAVVVSVPDPALGERSCAFIQPRGPAPKPVEIRRWMGQRQIAAFKIPDEIRFVDGFATTAVGKISRKELRARLRANLQDQGAK
ncbi:(2,3-dihydroxybenzoyl)adenylate synthase [Puniceibacterium sp. IMCC21224]|uniref:(2,3-dihydroxybenzoyl)adenylate synthase n=1 Tax=Puniceibacterium sp. IMCC21224 TaxID=1618204 RepID=UPI00064DFB26|nr:AMP-binding protein [Puniceibacterium sp. IMCC21224]KMK66992.1 peptide arylation enzyme [Puniceibacterium sp. IMCC21224]